MASTGRVDLNALLIFAAVAEAGGFTAAADRLGIAKAKVSLEIARLEKQLGANLFNRTTRRVALTDAGQALYAESIPPLRSVEETLAQVGSRSADLKGALRIGCSVDHAVQSLAGVVSAFALLHPQVQIDVRTSDRVVDPVKEGIDVAMRMGWLRDSTLRAVKLGDFEQQVVASPGYLQRAGRRPRQPQDLADHEWVALDLLRSPLTWKFSAADGTTQTVRMKGRLRADSAATLRSLLENDAGVSVLDQYSAAQAVRAGRLVRLLPRWSLPTGGLYAVFPPGRHMPAIVRAFVEFYRSTLQ